MNITLTITVTEDPNVSMKTHARGVSAEQVRPMLRRAARALQAEIDALEVCLYHANADTSDPQDRTRDAKP